MDFNKLNRIINSPAILAMQKNQNLFSQMNKMSSMVNPLSLQAIRGIQDMGSMLPFTQTMTAIEKTASYKTFLPQLPNYQSQLPEITKALRPSNALLAAIDSSSIFFRSFSNSGVFDAISAISKNMSAMQAIGKLNSLIPHVDSGSYDISFTEENEILLDNEPITRDDIFQIANVFENLSLENINEQSNISKLKSKSGSFFLSFLGFILLNLTIQPLLNDTFEVARKYLGIDKILEKIDIKSWADEKLFSSYDVNDTIDIEEDDTDPIEESITEITQEP